MMSAAAAILVFDMPRFKRIDRLAQGPCANVAEIVVAVFEEEASDKKNGPEMGPFVESRISQSVSKRKS
jgi:hypothetical protein